MMHKLLPAGPFYNSSGQRIGGLAASASDELSEKADPPLLAADPPLVGDQHYSVPDDPSVGHDGYPMQPFYEELDFCQTELGELMLRRRIPVSMPDTWVYEVKLDNRFLMSSLVHDSEDELARLSLRRLEGREWRVLVGGLGLGHTVAAVMAWEQVDAIDVVEYLQEVIDWHRRDLVPLSAAVAGDDRCRIVQGDCFQWIRDGTGGSYDAVLIDVDDSPEHLLSPRHGSFYTSMGLADARRSLRPGGVFALWTAGDVLPDFLNRMRRVFGDAEAEAVEFYNPLHSLEEVNTIYVAQV